MTDYIASSSDLTTVANAIRSKTGGTSSLAFPNGMAAAINSIPSYTTYDGSVANVYNITATLTNCSANSSNPTIIDSLSSTSLTYIANEGYEFSSVAPTVTNASVVSWTPATGVLVLNNAIGNVSFSLEAVTSYQYTQTGSEVTLNNAPYLQSGTEVTIE